jgi:hypothetical protein
MRRATGADRGIFDPNPLINAADLFGTGPRSMGVLAKMRYTHWVIAGAADYRRSALLGMEFRAVPRGENPTVDELACAGLVNRVLADTPYQSLASLVADVDDRLRTYGHDARQLQIVNASVYLHPLEPWAIAEVMESKLGRLEAIRVNTQESGQVTIDPPRLVLFARKMSASNWRGMSGYRKILSIFEACSQDLQIYLEQRRLERGFLYVQETAEGGGFDQESDLKVLNWLVASFNGESRPLKVPLGYELAHLAATNPGLSEFVPRMQHYDQQIREAVSQSLQSLGISATGSLALGTAFRIADAKKFRASVDETLAYINGDTAPEADWIGTLCEHFGFDRDLRPRIELETQIEAEISIPDIVAAQAAGLLPVITDASKRRIAESLGLDPGPEFVAAAAPDPANAESATTALAAPLEPSGYVTPPAVRDAASDALAAHKSTRPALRTLTGALERLAKRLAEGAPMSEGDVRQLAAMLRQTYPGTLQARQSADWETRGPGWQAWHAMGGDAAMQWAQTALVDGVATL